MTVFPKSRPYMGSITILKNIMRMIATIILLKIACILPREYTVKYIPRLKIIQQSSILKNDILLHMKLQSTVLQSVLNLYREERRDIQ